MPRGGDPKFFLRALIRAQIVPPLNKSPRTPLVRSAFSYIISYFPKDELLVNHLKSLKELVDRDKNRPSVVMWSVGNEPKSYR